ncbi:hypothetical protein Trydic_g18322 [Trypoxylus dichotomus]
MSRQILNTELYLKEFVLNDDSNNEKEWCLINDQKESHHFKILKDTYNKATHWFFTIVNLTTESPLLTAEYLSSELVPVDQLKATIIQWESEVSSQRLIFFRQSNSSSFGLLDTSPYEILTEREFTSQVNFNLHLLLKALQNGIGGSFTGSLLDVTLDVKQEFDGWRFIDYSAKNDDPLLTRFLMLFPWNLNERNEDGLTVLEVAAEYAGPQTIAALLDMPIMSGFTIGKLFSISQKELLLTTDAINDSPLIITIEKGKAATLQFLIDCGVDINYQMKSMGQEIAFIERAWKKRRYDNVLTLLKSDSPYPSEYEVMLLKENTNAIALRKFTEEIVKFHNSLREGKKDEIVRFVESYPCLKKAHDLNNQSALMTALKAHQYEIFTFLQSKGFTTTENEDLPIAYESLSDQQKEELKDAKLKYFRKQDNAHITFLLSRSKIRVAQSANDYFICIKDLFEQLDDIPEMSTIMKVLEHSEYIEIIFCLDHNFLTDANKYPTISDYRRGCLFIEVTQPQQTIHALAKELAHLAIQNVYKNDLYPYASLDNKNQSVLKEIVDKYHNRLQDLDPIIKEVFTTYQNSDDWLSELIVRVPLSSIDCGQNVEQLKEHLAELYTFYENQVQKNFLKYIADPICFKCEYKIQCLNDLLGDLDEIQKSRIWLKEECLLTLDLFYSQNITILITSLPKLAKYDLYQMLTCTGDVSNIRNHCIFATSNHFKNKMQVKEMYDLYKSPVKPMLIIDCTCGDISALKDLWISIDRFRDRGRTIVIAKGLLEENYSNFKATIINKQYKWSDLNIVTQSFLLEKCIDFQGYKITLNELAIAETFVINLVPLEMLIEDREIIICQPLPTSYGFHESFYITRTFNSQLIIKDTIIADIMKGTTSWRIAYTKTEFQMLCEKYPLSSVHWISKEETGQLIWQQSRGDINELRAYIDSKNQRLFPQGDIWKLLQQARHQKTMILSDAAGVGKTTVLTYLSKEIKRNLPTYWVALINLNIYTEELGKQTAREMGGLQFLVKELLKLNCPLEKALFEHSLNNGRVILMLDGFDEVCPLYKSIVTDLIFDLSKTQIEQLWVSTRPHLQFELECRLNQLSYALESFSVTEQIDFLIKFWKQTLKLPAKPDELRMKLYAEALLDRLMQSINDDTRIFAGIPLQIRMLAEAFSQEFSEFYFSKKSTIPELPAKLDLLTVYRRFLHNKYRIYVGEKNKPPTVTVATKDLVSILKGGVNLRKLHQQMALEVLFPRQKDTLLQTKKIHFLPQEQFNRIGNYSQISNHQRTVMYQAVSDDSSNMLDTLWLWTEEAQVNSVSEFVRLFLVKDENLATLWHEIAKQGHANIFDKLYKWATNVLDANYIKSLLLGKDSFGKTVWHYAVSHGNYEILEKLWFVAKERYFESWELKEMLLNTDADGENAWHYATYNSECLNMLEKLTNWANLAQLNSSDFKKIFLEANKTGRTVLHLAVLRGNIHSLERIWELGREVLLTDDELKHVLLSTNDMHQTIAGDAAKVEDVRVLQKIRSWAKELKLNNEELRKLFFSSDKQGINGWQTASSETCIDILWMIAQEIRLSKNELKHMLLSTNVFNKNVWLAAIEKGQVGIVERVWNYLKRISLTTTDLRQVFLKKTRGELQSLELIADHKDERVLRKLLVLLEEIFTLREISDMLMSRVNQRKTLWHHASVRKNTKVLNAILEWANEKLSGETLQDFLDAKLTYEKTMLFISTWSRLSLERALKWCKENLPSKDFKKMILRKRLLGKYVWNLKWEGEKVVIEELLRWCKQNLTIEELIDMMRMEDGSDQILFRVITEGCLEVLMDLWNWNKDLEVATHFRRLFIWHGCYDRNGTVLHSVIRRRNTEFFMYLWRWMQQMQLTKQEFRNIVFTTDLHGDTFVHIVNWLNATKSVMDILEKILECLKTVFESQVLKELLIRKNFKNETVLHSLAYCRQCSELLQLLQWCIRNLTQDEFKELMLERYNQGETVLHVLAKQDVKGWFDVIEWLEKNLEWDNFSEVFLAVNDRDRHSMKVAQLRISEGRIKGTLDDELFDKSGGLEMLEDRCKHPERKVLALPFLLQ